MALYLQPFSSNILGLTLAQVGIGLAYSGLTPEKYTSVMWKIGEDKIS